MARIARTSRIRTELFDKLHDTSRSLGDTNDCAVKAICVVTGITYEDAQARLAAKGRVKGKGTFFVDTVAVMRELGFTLERVNTNEVQARYPRSKTGGYVYKNLTTHHFELYNEVWADGHNYLVRTNGHIAGVQNGTLHDWTKGRAIRISDIYRVVKK